ncbi:MAG: MFS transporter [Alphaproteobacteria bacterium]|nr:MFS transporter [Alphaproteobacteria bacterium]
MPRFGRDARVNTLISCGHFLSHYYSLCLPPLFIAWQHTFGVSFAKLGLAMALMSGTAAIVQAPIGFLVDRYGARRFLVGGTLLMTMSVAAMSLATAFWQIALLAMLSGLGNSVFHPADYAILSGSINRARIGRSFALHTFVGQVGFAIAPPVTAALMLLVGWRGALTLVGLLGIPVVLAILWQSRILLEQKRDARQPAAGLVGDLRGLFSRSILSFFGFFMVSAMAGAGVQSWLITILHRSHGLTVEAASSVLTTYMTGMMVGVLIGGWVAERTDRHLGFVVTMTMIAAAVLLAVGIVAMPQLVTLAVMLVGGVAVGARNTPRDVMVKDAAAPGQIGKVFGFVSAGMMMGSAIMPVPYGMLIDAGHPELVLVAAAGLSVMSLLFAGNARASHRREPIPVAAD